MFNLPEFEDKDVVVIGAGREGKSFDSFIHENASLRSLKFI